MKKLMKKIISVLLSVVMLLTTLSISVFAADSTNGTCGDNLIWTFDEKTGELLIDGTGAMYNYGWNTPWQSYIDAIKTVVIGKSVTIIGNYAFNSCLNLTNVTIGDSVTTIGNYAFHSCVSITNIMIPDSVASIGHGAFYNCDSLTYVTIPKSVTTIGGSVFASCESVTSIEVDAGNEHYSSDSYGVLYNKNKTELIQYPIGNERTEFTIPDSVTTIGDRTFLESTNLTSIIIPKGVITIGNYAFRECNNLISVKIPDGVTKIGDYAFYWCDSLTSVTLPDSVTTIGDSAFYDCNGLKRVTIGNGVTSIGKYAFSSCDSINDVYYSGTEGEWNEVEIGEYNESLLNATIHYNYGKPSGNLGENIIWSFNEENKILSITGSGEMLNLSSAEEYGWYFFKDEIEAVEFANSIVSVGDNGFSGYPNLKEVYLGQTVEQIGVNTFVDCPSLAIVSSYALNFTANENSFSNNDDRLIFLYNSANAQAAEHLAKLGLNGISVYYDYDKKVMNYGGELTVYQDLPYLFLSKFVKQNPGMEYLYFEKLVFHGIEPEIIDIEELENDTQAKYLTFNKLYVSLKKVKDGSVEGVTFENFLTLLENGDYDSFMFELQSDEGKQQLTFIEILEKIVDEFVTSALRITSKIINFFRKIFK